MERYTELAIRQFTRILYVHVMSVALYSQLDPSLALFGWFEMAAVLPPMPPPGPPGGDPPKWTDQDWWDDDDDFEEEEEEEEDPFQQEEEGQPGLRRCRYGCGFITYLRKRGCANPGCETC